MPWSEWVEYGTAKLSPDRLTLEFSPYGSSAYYPTRGTVQIDATLYPDAGVQTRHGEQFTAPSNWRWWRDEFPTLLDGLVEGVDYGANPDTGDYVEYEPGVENTLDGWDMGTSYLSQARVNNTSGGAASMQWAAGVLTGTAYAGGDISGWPGLGAVYATGDQLSPWGGYLPTPVDPGPVESLSMLADVTALTGSDALVNVVVPQPPMVRLRLPRFRYWMLADAKPKPLRQRQRDDGLGLSTARWSHGSSRQVSNRWRGYL